MDTKSCSGSKGRGKLCLLWLLCCLGAGGLLIGQGVAASRTTSPAHASTKAIEAVRVGDWVLAKDPNDSGRPSPRRVTAVPRNYTLHVVYVSVAGGGQLQATREHPFFTRNRGWVHAQDLQAEDKLQDSDGAAVSVVGVRTEEQQATTYNLTVDGVHTFYALAGVVPVLVHNTDVENVPTFDEARRLGFDRAGMNDPSTVQMGKPDATGTYTEFKGPNGAKVAYDGPHADMNPALGHDKPHVGYQSGGKRGAGGAQRGNVTYDGPPGPARSSVKVCD